MITQCSWKVYKKNRHWVALLHFLFHGTSLPMVFINKYINAMISSFDSYGSKFKGISKFWAAHFPRAKKSRYIFIFLVKFSFSTYNSYGSMSKSWFAHHSLAKKSVLHRYLFLVDKAGCAWQIFARSLQTPGLYGTLLHKMFLLST